MRQRIDTRRAGQARPSRHVLENGRRAARARDHLAAQRARERERLARRERKREEQRRAGRAATHSARSRWQLPLFALSLGLGIVITEPVQSLLLRLSAGEFGELEKIAIQGHVHRREAEIAAATGVLPGSPLAQVDPEQVEATLQGLDWIAEAHVARLPPGTLLVSITEREGIAVLADASDPDTWQLIDATGTPFAPPAAARIEGLPRLHSMRTLTPGEPHDALRTGLSLAGELAARASATLSALPGTPEIHMPTPGSREGWTLRFSDLPLEIVLGREQLIARLDRLETLVAGHVEEFERVERIDLRFADRAVLRRGDGPG